MTANSYFQACSKCAVIVAVCSDGPPDPRPISCTKHVGEDLGLTGIMKL